MKLQRAVGFLIMVAVISFLIALSSARGDQTTDFGAFLFYWGCAALIMLGGMALFALFAFGFLLLVDPRTKR